ncbi:MAG: hypothetical protein ACUVXJ_04575 [Phycisphaerae bacterium]
MAAECQRRTTNGWGMLGFLILATLALAALLIAKIVEAANARGEPGALATALLIAYVLG